LGELQGDRAAEKIDAMDLEFSGVALEKESALVANHTRFHKCGGAKLVLDAADARKGVDREDLLQDTNYLDYLSLEAQSYF